jgi:REP element-mobilizing transposase RayT
LIESITYRAEWCGIRAIVRGEVESPKWNRGYYIASAGQISAETVKKHIEEQKTRW